MKIKRKTQYLIITITCLAIAIGAACLIGCATKQGDCVDQALATAAVAERHGVAVKAVVGQVKGQQHVEIMGDGKTWSWDSVYWELKESQGVSSRFEGPVREYPIDIFRAAAMNHNPLHENQLKIYQEVIQKLNKVVEYK